MKFTPFSKKRQSLISAKREEIGGANNTYKEWDCGIPKLNDFGLKALYCDPPVKTFLGH